MFNTSARLSTASLCSLTTRCVFLFVIRSLYLRLPSTQTWQSRGAVGASGLLTLAPVIAGDCSAASSRLLTCSPDDRDFLHVRLPLTIPFSTVLSCVNTSVYSSCVPFGVSSGFLLGGFDPFAF